MRYLIDGYNLLHATGELSGKVGPHGLEKARQRLLGRLAAFVKGGAGGVTVIFDARRAPATVPTDQVYHGVSVRYTLDREADDLIEELIRHDSAPRALTVVSDDHRVRDAARRRHCTVQACLDFHDETGKTPRVPPAEEAPERPRMLSDQEVQAWMKRFGVNDEG